MICHAYDLLRLDDPAMRCLKMAHPGFGGTFLAACALINMRQRPQELSDAALKARADKLFKIKEAQRIDAPFAMAEYRAAENDARRRIARLRAERLAREAANGPFAAPGKSGGKSSSKPSGTSRP